MMTTGWEYRQQARTSPLFYLILVVGVIFTASGVAIDPSQSCVEYPCPFWLRALVTLIGILFATGAIFAIVRGFQYGSRVDVARGALVWWEGVPPIREHLIPLDKIARIEIDNDAEDSLGLFDAQGRRLKLSARCVPYPHGPWARRLVDAFPHIDVVEEGPIGR